LHPGFRRHELKARYDVENLDEDAWHSYTGSLTEQLVCAQLDVPLQGSPWLLNAGAGVYSIGVGSWKEVYVDLFESPIRSRPFSICCSVERLPFSRSAFGAIVSVGEVLAYCDPAAAIHEFARVSAPSGILICDFASSRSVRYWMRPQYGRAADLIVDEYNGTPERTWVYDPRYIRTLLRSAGFEIKQACGTHTWSSLARRIGVPPAVALSFQKQFEPLQFLGRWADLVTIVAERVSSATL
jgi:SAM-dependent methyltransferase